MALRTQQSNLLAESSLREILEAIHAAGATQVNEIESRTQIQVNEILASAHSEAQEIEEMARRAAAIPAGRERARMQHRARLEALRIRGAVREELVERALEQSRGQLANLRSRPEYPQILRHLTLQALADLHPEALGSASSSEVDPGDVNSDESNLGDIRIGAFLHADLRDRVCLDNILQELSLAVDDASIGGPWPAELRIIYDLETWGGVVAKSADGKIVVINTLEARLERAEPYLRHYLAAWFEGQTLTPKGK